MIYRRIALKFVLGLLTSVAVIFAIEGAMRLLPLDRWEQELPDNSYPLFIRGTGGLPDWYTTNSHFQGVIPSVRFSKVKPKGVTRIFVVGGSAARGWPGPVESAFSGYMQRALNEVSPGRFEILNVAGMSYGSRRVLDLLKDIVLMDPDLVIVWSGNNEYVERTTLPPLAQQAWLASVQRELRHSSLYRAIRLGLYSVSPSLFARPVATDITDLRKKPAVRRENLVRGSEVDQQVLENYRSNLREMVQLLDEHNARAILATVPINLSQWEPRSLQPSFPDSAAEKNWGLLQNAVSSSFGQGKFAMTIPLLQEMVVLAPSFAATHYLLGECYRNLGRYVEAQRSFERARDLDMRPIRALTSFERVIREVALEHSMQLVDLERTFLLESGDKMVGLDLFLDHVHLNEAGHKLAAKQFLTSIIPTIDPSINIDDLTGRVQRDNWNVRNTYRMADTHYVLGLTYHNNGDYARAEEAFLKALEENPTFSDPAGNLGVLYVELGNLPLAEKFLRQAVDSDAGTVHKLDLAQLLYRRGALSESLTLAQQLRDQGVLDYVLFTLLGDIAAKQGDATGALSYYRQALAVGAIDPKGLLFKMGDIYRKIGDEANARETYARAATL